MSTHSRFLDRVSRSLVWETWLKASTTAIPLSMAFGWHLTRSMWTPLAFMALGIAGAVLAYQWEQRVTYKSHSGGFATPDTRPWALATLLAQGLWMQMAGASAGYFTHVFWATMSHGGQATPHFFLSTVAMGPLVYAEIAWSLDARRICLDMERHEEWRLRCVVLNAPERCFAALFAALLERDPAGAVLVLEQSHPGQRAQLHARDLLPLLTSPVADDRSAALTALHDIAPDQMDWLRRAA